MKDVADWTEIVMNPELAAADEQFTMGWCVTWDDVGEYAGSEQSAKEIAADLKRLGVNARVLRVFRPGTL